MVLLIHHPVSAISRKIRLLMAEKRILFVLREEEPWNLSPEIYKLNVAGELPIFIFDGNVIASNYAITEFLEEVNPDVRLIGGDARQKAEIRRLTEWFDLKFEREVGRSLINEKVFKRFGKGLAPDSKVLKTALNNLNFHMEYIDWLCESRNYLAGSSFRWPTSPPPLIFRSSTIWGTCRGKATKTPGCGIRKSSPAPLSKTF